MKYKPFNSTNRKHIEKILNICKEIGLVQQTAQYCIKLYYKVLVQNELLDDYDLITIVYLGSKIANIIIDIDFLIKKSDNLLKLKIDKNVIIKKELELCILIDFCFSISDYGDVYKDIVKKFNLSKIITQSLWILINDSLYTSVYLYYSDESIVVSCLYIALYINKEVLGIYKEVLGIYKISNEDVQFIGREILSIYS